MLFGMLVYLPVQAKPVPRLYLVFPPENLSSRPDVGWLSEGIAEILSSRLDSSASYALGREERNAAYIQMGFPAGAPLTLASDYVIAETLGVRDAVTGTFSVSGDKLTTRIRVLDLQHLKLSPWFEVSGDLNNLVAIETELAWKVLSFSNPHFVVGDEQAFAREFAPIRLDAFENYIRGVLSTDVATRINFLKRASILDPSEHRADFQLGKEYFDKKDYEQSAHWLAKLKPGDDFFSQSRFLLGVDDFFLGNNNDAYSEFDSLAKDVPLDQVLNNLGVIEAREGHYTQAALDFERAHNGNPTDADYDFNLAVSLWYERKYDQVVPLVEAVLKQQSDDADAHSLLAAVLGEVGDAAGRKRQMAWLSGQGDAPRADATADFVSMTRIKKTYDGRAFRLLSLEIQGAREARISNEGATDQIKQAPAPIKNTLTPSGKNGDSGTVANQ